MLELRFEFKVIPVLYPFLWGVCISVYPSKTGDFSRNNSPPSFSFVLVCLAVHFRLQVFGVEEVFS